MASYRAAEQKPGSDPTRLRLEPIPGTFNLKPFENRGEARTSSVQFVRPGHWMALIRSAPGVCMPDNLKWEFYERDRAPDETQYAGQNPAVELILRARNDPVMEYIAREDRVPGIVGEETYFALTDWEAGQGEEGDTQAVLVTPMMVRSYVRDRDNCEEAFNAPLVTLSYAEQKKTLGQTFGTRKARKAIDDRDMNDLRAGQTDDGQPEKLNAADKATLEQIKLITSSMSTKAQLQAAADASKPGPPANTEATEIADVYDTDVFIGAGVLQAVPILDWQETLQRHESIVSPSQFVARRVERIARQDEPDEKLRLLRYLNFVIRFYVTSKNGKRNDKIIPQKDVLAQNLAPAPPAVIENIRRKFSVDGVIDDFHTQRLITYCCTMSLIIDNFETAVDDLRQDLGLSNPLMRKYFVEIGARLLRRQDDSGKYFCAQLALPLQLPKQSRGVPAKKR